MLFAVFVLFGVRRGIAAQPELFNKLLAFFVGGFVKRDCFHAARIEPAVEDVDDLAFARGLVAGDDEQDRKRRLLERDLHLH